eukprot:TRINITY_DN3501_c0_g1_i1.p1 TRINITY_DN3501_c0_g1~~TRINITY_DN3501_c0_g1_i1.p1  ORF type:complete len:399 (+),score=174.54 TRINITY_DN3501_c0_g1_i1:3-1199(+)
MAETDPQQTESKQVVTPFDVATDDSKGLDYDKLIRDFGSLPLDQAIIDRFAKLTGAKPHPWMARGYFFSHRDFNLILDLYEAKKPFYLYTGRGPSSDSMHFGHLIPFVFTKWLQDVFKVPLVIQMTDDEKFMWKNITLEDAHRYMRENVRDIIAVGFDVTRTFIFSDLKYLGTMYPNIVKIQKCITVNQVKHLLGLKDESNIAQVGYTAIQAAPSFCSSFPHIFGDNKNIPCLIPCAIDQDPFFRMTRDVAPRLGFEKPALIHSKFFPALQGKTKKMSGSDASSSIYLTDTPDQIKSKIKLHAFSGGRVTLEEQKEKGADLDIDVPFQYLEFFLEDEEKLEDIRIRYGQGGKDTMTTDQVKTILIDVLSKLVVKHQKAKSLVTDAVIDSFLAVRKLHI